MFKEVKCLNPVVRKGLAKMHDKTDMRTDFYSILIPWDMDE